MTKGLFKLLTTALMLGSLTLSNALVYADMNSGTIRTQNVDKKAYADLAKIPLQDAVKAAMASVPGKAINAELKDRNGFLVYEVKVESPNKKVTKVYVDAGDSKVLESEED